MNDPTADLFTPRDAHNYRVFHAWFLGALIVFMAGTLLIKGSVIPTAVGWVFAVLTALLMVVAMRSYMSFLRQADELLRKVHLDSLAFAFGAGMVVMMAYRLCERLGAPKLDVNDAGLVMMVTWVAGQWIGARRYAAAEEK